MAQYDSQPEMTIDLDKTYSATLHTSHGDIDIEFDAAASPLTVNNFVFLARDGFYDGVIFHRVIKGFMIQGGDPTGTGMGGPGYRFRDELEGPGRYSRGTVAMANAGPNTNGSQFFIMHADYGLPHNYTIFGQVSDGLDVVDAIATTPTGAQDRPHEDCVINSVTITES
jgi:cyclophilin family peptidyl-prolyl cis-trans isomerase